MKNKVVARLKNRPHSTYTPRNWYDVFKSINKDIKEEAESEEDFDSVIPIEDTKDCIEYYANQIFTICENYDDAIDENEAMNLAEKMVKFNH